MDAHLTCPKEHHGLLIIISEPCRWRHSGLVTHYHNYHLASDHLDQIDIRKPSSIEASLTINSSEELPQSFSKMWEVPSPLYFLQPWRQICPLGNIVRCRVLGAHPPVKVLVMLIQARGYHFPSAVGVSDWQGIQFQNLFLGACFVVYSWYKRSYLEFPWKAVWDKELDAVGLLWEIIPRGQE